MSGTARFTATVGLKDEVSAPLRAIAAQFARIGRTTGLARIAEAASGAGRAFGGLAMRVGSIAGPMAAIGGAAAGIGLLSATRRTADAAGAFADLSAQTGVAVEDLQELSDAARLAGVDEATLAGALQRLNRGLAEAATGGGGDLGPMLRHLGISIRDANGQIRNAADLLPQLAEAFKNNENQALRTRAATELFGRAGVQLIPMLANGRAALEESRKRFREFGFSMGENAERLAANSDQFENLQVATEGLSHAIGAQLAPILGPIAQQMARWVRTNRDLIATGIGDWALRVSETFKQFLTERGPLERLSDFGASIGRVVDSLGGFRNVMIGFGALAVAPFAAAVLGIVTALAPVAVAVGKLALALGAGSPLGIALISLAGAAYLIHKNWDWLGGYLGEFWSELATGMAPQIDMLRQFAEAVGEPLVAGLRAAWSGLTDFFTGLWNGIAATFAAAWLRLQPVVNAIAAAVAPLRLGSSPTGPVNSPGAQAQRRANQARGGATRIDEDNLSSLAFPPLPNPFAGAVLAAPPREGRVEVEVNVNGLPPGSRVEATSQGNLVQAPRTNVGFAFGRVSR